MNAPFTIEELQQAHAEWGCNCGPATLAFAARLPLQGARHAIRGFDSKRYTSPTMMKDALTFLGVGYEPMRGDLFEAMFDGRVALTRVQWTGPWTKPGANPRWAYGYTHWIATWLEGPAVEGGVPLVFDVNFGITSFLDWDSEGVRVLTRGIARADGGWRPTHVWRISKSGAAE
ncbi:MAG: hypothetical protein AMXMBFR77_26550 [Phycisphaerales bacterium]